MSSSSRSAPQFCRGVNKQGKPCSVSWGLSFDGYCKFHQPNATQCFGVSRTSGQRCKIKWDLDSSGYCVHHRSQAPTTTASAIPNACRGITKSGTPCSVSWGLDADGFCKYHVANASQCKGLARATGRRCKIKWGLDAQGYCQFHRRVDAPVARQCEAVSTTGRRCLQTVGIDADGFCTAHRVVKTELPVCQGLLPGSNKRCGNNAKMGYDFCCAAHDPKFAASYVAPSLFNDPGLRSSVEGDIIKLFKGRDLYHGDKLDLNTVGAVELDHILEKQCFAYAFQRVEFQDDEAQDVAFLLREEVVNELPNLCLTRATTNKIKGAAVSKFLDDSLTGHRGSKTFTDYLLGEKRDDTRLTRDVTRTIRSEMGSALRKCQRKLVDAGETPALEALSAEFQQLYVDMDFRASQSNKTKTRTGVTRTAKEDNDEEYILVDSAKTDSWTMVDIKRTVKIEARHPKLSAEAKPFVPRAVRLAKTDSHKDVGVASGSIEHCKLEPDKVETKVTESKVSIESSSLKVGLGIRGKFVKQDPASKQVSSESTSELAAKREDTKLRR